MKVGVTIKDELSAGVPPEPTITLEINRATGDVHAVAAGGFSPDYDGVMHVAEIIEDVAEAIRSMAPESGTITKEAHIPFQPVPNASKPHGFAPHPLTPEKKD